MRIVHVANLYGPRSGGVRTTIHELGRGYRAAGHEFILVVPGKGYTARQFSFGTRITVPSIPVRRLGYRVVPTEIAVRRVLAEVHPDRLEVSDRTTLRRLGVWARKRDIPAVMFSHEKLSDWFAQLLGKAPVLPRSRLADGIADRINSASLKHYQRIVCSTAYAAEEFERLDPAKVERVSLGVDLQGFSPEYWSAEVRQRYLGTGEVLLCATGRLSIEKAPHLAIDAVRELRSRGTDARLVMAGDGMLSDRMRRHAEGVPVTFTGHIADRQDLATLVASCDVSIHPGPVETFCLAALESLACGTPIAASESSALPELVTPGSGETAGASGAAFADAIERILTRSTEDRRTAARARATEFPWRRTVERMLEVHESLGNLR